ncbi:MAG: S-layer homology domain-containing protein [Anaerotignum sp.]|nr:S-layer homology domain-containing protein [Anaerotignum sp.]
MLRTKNKAVAVFMAFVMMLSLLPTFAPLTVSAASTVVYQDGTYEGTGEGYKGKITLSVTITEGKISEITEIEHSETANFWNTAKEIFADIIRENSPDVDAVTGATRSSNGIKAAVKDALSKAVDSGIFESGDGSEENPYIIQTAEQLKAFAEAVDEGESYDGEFVALGDDITLDSEENWNPIGTEGKAEETTKTIFNGTFDGRGYTISGLTIKDSSYTDESNLGLFSALNNEAVVKNLNLTGVDIVVSASDAVLRAGAISGDTVKGTNADSAVATLIDTCSAQGSVKVSTDGAKLIFGGGLVGRGNISSVFINCWTDMDIDAESRGGNQSAYAGGIIGNSGNNAKIINCITFGDNSGKSPVSTNFGGMAGGISAMFAGKQWNTAALGNSSVGNDGSKHKWVGALYGQITTSGMTRSGNDYVYPETGALRDYGYYADDITLTINSDSTDLVPTGVGTINHDTVFATSENVKALERSEMESEAFAERMNKNLLPVSKLMEAFGIEGLSLREWVFEEGKALPSGDTWVNTEPDASIFASGSGTESDPYIIMNEAQLRAFGKSQTEGADYSGKFIALGADIQMENEWTPIGDSEYAFAGTFDGKGYEISGLKMSGAVDGKKQYVGLFSILDVGAVVKNLTLSNVDFDLTCPISVYMSGVAGYMAGDRNSNKGAIIDGVKVYGKMHLTVDKGNTWVGGIAAQQYKGAVINSMSDVEIDVTTKGSNIAQGGGIVALNNRGLIANCYGLGDVTGSGNRENGNEGMASISGLVGVNAGPLVGSYSKGDLTTKEHSVYAGAVSGWVTGIGKSYSCFYNTDSVMTINGNKVNVVESIGTKVPAGMNEEGDTYIGGLVDDINGYALAEYSGIADKLNAKFSTYPIDITQYGLSKDALKAWTYDSDKNEVTFGDSTSEITYVQPDCENVPVSELVMRDGDWYGRDAAKTTVVKISVSNNSVTKEEAVSGQTSGDAYNEALEKAKEKAIYGDTSGYGKPDTSIFEKGTGTAESPYIVETEEQLRFIAEAMGEDNSWENVHFLQAADIDVSAKEWLPIGWGIRAEIKGADKQYCAYPFCGNYDGGNYKITGLKIGSTEEATKDPRMMYTAGLFGFAAGELPGNIPLSDEYRNVNLKNIHLEGIDINVDSRYTNYIGGLIGNIQNGFVIDHCSVTGSIRSRSSDKISRGGGISGNVLRGLIKDTFANVNITVDTDAGNSYGGGFAAMDNRTTIVNCYALGDVQGNANNTNKVHIGGFIGQAGGIHYNCYAFGDVVSLKDTTDVGGMNGRLAGIGIDRNCYFNSDAVQSVAGVKKEEPVSSGVVVPKEEQNMTEGKTAEEMKSQDFANLLNANKAKTSDEFKEINDIVKGLDLVHPVYYENDGSDLRSWTVKEDSPAVFGEKAGGNFVLMNIPYADFYEAEGVSGVDAVTSATLNKPRTGTLAGGSYHVDPKGTDISGVIYPVLVEDMSVLEGLKEITDDSSVEITVTNRGQTSTTTYTGKDALFESEHYSYYVLKETPERYKTLTVANGKKAFSAVNGDVTTVEGVTGEVKIGTSHGEIEIPLSGTTGINQGDVVSGVILTFADGSQMALRHIENLWRAVEIGGSLKEFSGKTIKNIRYITKNAMIDFPVEIEIPEAGYVLMNIPYADFYKGEKIEGVDAVTSATKKAYGQQVTGSYHDGEDETYASTDILGVTYPVLTEKSLLDSSKKVDSEEALFAAGDYSYFEMTAKPNLYKKLTKNSGSYEFAAVNGRAAAYSEVTAEITALTKRGDYGIKLSGDQTENLSKGTVYGVILTDENGKLYALRHLENIWKGVELAFCTGHTETIKNGALTPNNEMYKDLEGKKITQIKYFFKNENGTFATCTIGTDLLVSPYPTASFTNASTIKLANLSAKDLETASVNKDASPTNYYSATIKTSNGQVFAQGLNISADGAVSLGKNASTGKYTIEIIQSKEKNGKMEDSVMAVMTAEYTAGSSGGSSGGGGASTVRYEVEAGTAENGKITVNPAKAASGSTVKVTLTPDEGFEADSVTVKDKDGNNVSVTKESDGTYSFKMPAGKVTVSGSFKEKTEGETTQTEPQENPAPAFKDVKPDAWYKGAVDYVSGKGIMFGTSDDAFEPDVPVTRAMFTTILYRLEGSPAVSGSSSFSDIAQGKWYTNAVIWAESSGVVKGFDDSTFKPDAKITREQMAALFMRYAAFKGIDTSKRADLSNFKDAGEISAWALENVRWANAEGLVSGRTADTIVPQGNATRAETASTIMRFCENILK